MNLTKAFFFIFFISAGSAFAQSTNVSLGNDYCNLVERYEIRLGGFYKAYHNAIKPYTRQGVALLADSAAAKLELNETDQFNIEYLQNDNWEWSATSASDSEKPFLKKFYRKKNDFYHVDEEDFNLQVNPVLYLGIGHDDAALGRPYINTRGIEIRGMISKRLSFYTFLTDNQMSNASYVQERVNETGVVPNEGFWKSYGTKGGGYDFFTTRGYISFDVIKNINLQFGHDKFFIGNGYRSLVLSDFSSPYLFLKLNTKVWRLNYTNIFAQMKADVYGNSGGLFGHTSFPNKYFAFHHLGLNITKNFSIGAFESVIFGRKDSVGTNNFNFNYLNPIIFYRSIEQYEGSQDNALLGVDFRWILFKKLSLYGQFMLDEFLLKEVKARNGWWGNKFAAQAGFKLIDAGIKNLDLQGEINIAKPYTYAHESGFTNYSHFRQPLAHPLGANFREVIGIVRYQPIPRLMIALKGIYAGKGEDDAGINYGGDILKNYTTRFQEYGNKMAQGIPSTIKYADATISYMIKHNCWLEIQEIYRTNETSLPGKIKTSNYFLLGIRWNIAKRTYEF